jgi:hypothetical protein
MSEGNGSKDKAHSSSTHSRARSDRRWWRYNGALAPVVPPLRDWPVARPKR